MKILYSLLFIFLLQNSLFAGKQSEKCDTPMQFVETSEVYGPISYYDTYNYNGDNYWSCDDEDMRYYTYTLVSGSPANEHKSDNRRFTYVIDYYEPAPPCESDPQPSGSPLKTYSGSDASSQCMADYTAGTNAGETGLTCWTDSCATDIGSEYTLFGTPNDSNSTSEPDSDGDGIPDKCDSDYDDYANSDCDGDGTPNSSDAAPNDGSNSTSCDALPSLYAIIDVPQSSCNVLAANQGRNGSVDYIKYLEWDNCRNTCIYKWGSCPRGENYQDGVCKTPDVSPNKTCNGTLRCKIYGETGALNVVGNNDTGEYPLMGCYSECTCYESLNRYIFSVDSVSCDDNDPLDEDEEEPTEYDDYENDNNSSLTPPDPLADFNGTVNIDSAESFKAALTSYDAAKESTNKLQLQELTKIAKINVDNQNILKDIASNTDSSSIAADKLNSKVDITNTKLSQLITATNNQDNTAINNLSEKIDTTNTKLETLIADSSSISEDTSSINENASAIANNTATTNTKLDTLIADSSSISEDTSSINENASAIANNTATTNTKLDALIDAIKDLNGSSSSSSSVSIPGDDGEDDSNSSSNYDNSDDLDTLNSSFDTLDDLVEDFTDFKSNLTNDLTTVQTSFNNAESLFKDGNLQLESTATIDSCPINQELMNRQYSLDLCEMVQPFSNVVYTLFYMLGFFGILITFIYIFILKGVD